MRLIIKYFQKVLLELSRVRKLFSLSCDQSSSTFSKSDRQRNPKKPRKPSEVRSIIKYFQQILPTVGSNVWSCHIGAINHQVLSAGPTGERQRGRNGDKRRAINNQVLSAGPTPYMFSFGLFKPDVRSIIKYFQQILHR